MTLSLSVLEVPLGVVVYDGPSVLDGEPIVAIATGLRSSENPKTGNMVQVWIIRKDMYPTEAYIKGEDKSVCGDCIHRKARTCYVNVFQAPHSIYKAYTAGRYLPVSVNNLKYFAGRLVRLGAYGDPAAVPTSVWRDIVAFAKGHTAYTHQWRNPKVDQSLREICMASCDSLKQAIQAKFRLWRPFRVLVEGDVLEKREFMCPASKEAGARLTCAECLACHGGTFKGQGSPAIFAHSVKSKRFTKIRKRKDKKKGWADLLPSY